MITDAPSAATDNQAVRELLNRNRARIEVKLRTLLRAGNKPEDLIAVVALGAVQVGTRAVAVSTLDPDLSARVTATPSTRSHLLLICALPNATEDDPEHFVSVRVSGDGRLAAPFAMLATI